MSAGVLAAVLTAAVLHAVWNSIAHRIPDKLTGFTLISLACTGCAAVLVCCTPLPPAGAWPFLATSAALQVASQLFLLRAYELGDFGQMYPLARGVAPLLVAIASVTLLGGTLTPVQATGVLLVSGGLAALALASGRIGRAQLPALGAALGSGTIIASYTLVDSVGVRHSSDVLAYTAWLFLLQGPVIPLIALARRRGRLLAQLRPVAGTGLAGGVLSMTAYGLVVWAQAHGQVAAVAALRETGILVAAVIATLVFREPFGRLRLVAGAVVLTGIGLMH
ncbi:EamA family transporter [Streptomyces sp. NEAU-sy36]|uniref:EamA family transporter n=1 Tax=unclassified Streptomyces TaxID=2593676 RepID=UPI0015D620BA|nr:MULTISPECIES: EamA family transporter [unclassified Streptomyces]QLJ06177.1 EamA family transporter [Streptomyces sp. NEAU-sy36]